MTSVPFAIVDVFSAVAFKGNPLAVVDNTTASLTTTQMQLIARQFNLSETTFISDSDLEKAHYKLRSFLPNGREVFGAGHNILGVWWWLAKEGFLNLPSTSSRNKDDGIKEFKFWYELAGEVLPVKILSKTAQGGGEPEITVLIRQASPIERNVHPDLEKLAHSIGLTASDIGFPESTIKLPPQVFSSSTTRHLLVPISSIEALDRVSVQRDSLLEQLALVDDQAYGLYLFSPALGEKDVYQARFFSPGMAGEDPATGSAAGLLSAYLYSHRQLKAVGGIGKMRVKQGLKVGRECLIDVTISQIEDENSPVLKVDLLDKSVKVASGEIQVPDVELGF